jgi:ABC-type antimicrobial peptide transport system ATPase subunit
VGLFFWCLKVSVEHYGKHVEGERENYLVVSSLIGHSVEQLVCVLPDIGTWLQHRDRICRETDTCRRRTQHEGWLQRQMKGSDKIISRFRQSR